jgi:hypothetical protein
MKSRRPRGVPGILPFIVLAGLATGCVGEGRPGDRGEEVRPGTESGQVPLGPKDGFDLPPTELERVAVGTTAPDFSLRSLAGDTTTLSDFRGAKDVVLVFYRGHW